MINQKRALIILEILLVVFVGVLVLRWVLLNKAIKNNEDYLSGTFNSSAKQTLTSPTVLTSDPFQGSNKAEIIIVTYEDFTCAYCSQMSLNLKELANKYPDKVKVVWKDFVGNLEQTGLRSAIAARCAQAQGKFWEFHDILFANQNALSDTFYKQIASDLGLEQTRFNSCFENQETLPLIQNSFSEGLALGVDATPYVFLGEERLSGLISFEELEGLID